MSDRSDDILSLVRSLMVKNYPKPWQRLWEDIHSLCQRSKITVSAALEVYRLAYECVSKEEEGMPVSTGFIVGDAESLSENLPDDAGIMVDHKSVSEQAELIRRLFGLVDGCTSVFAVGKDGALEGTRLLPEVQCSTDDKIVLSSYDFANHCEVLRRVDGFWLIALGNLKTAKLFTSGMLEAEVYFSGKSG